MECKRLGSFFEERREKVSDVDYSALSVTKNGIVPQLDTAAKTDAGDNRKLVKVNDFVINSRSDRKGSSGVSPYTGSVSLISIVMEPRRIYPAYAHHLLRSYPFQEEFYRYGKGIVADLWSTNSSEMKNILLPDLPIAEQQNIANFLDHETAKIDTLIAKQEKLIELLKEKRQAVISDLVNIKTDEKSVKLKFAVDILAGYSFSSTGFKTEEEKENGIALLRGINVGVDSVKWNEVVWWSKSDTLGLDRYFLKEGDIVFGMDRPWISNGARVAEITKVDLPSYLVQRVARIRALKDFYQPYIKLVLTSAEFKAFIESDLTGVSVPHISTDQIISFEIRNLKYEEQVKQTTKIIDFSNKVEALIIKAESAIQLMQERRTALISAAVTGKIDVRHWQSPNKNNEANMELSA
ncbi:hypothetical protein PYR73_15035 [Acinetobacter soli]|nr:hypothetical protein PX669_13870 [Acinetobacter soli]WEI09492.1 hypothetical protein PYR73_15035 [Acinetobacter soli]